MERKTRSAFKLRSGNKPSISKMAGVSPMKAEANLNTDEGRRQRRQEIRDNANKAIREGKLKPLTDRQLKQERINKDLDKFNYYKFGDTIITKPKSSPNKKTKLTDKITAALNAPFESASYKDLKRAYRGARKQGFNPKNLSKNQLDKLLEGKTLQRNQSYRVER